MTPLFQLQNASFSFGEVPALRDFSVQIAPGERVALLGANGSGKSTLLRILSALALPQKGVFKFDGQEINLKILEKPQFFRRRVQLVFQDPDVQLFCASVEEEIAFGPLQLGLSSEETKIRIENALETLKITALRDRSPHRLSGGEKKRVALAAVLALEPEVLLLDEPTASLDPRSQSEIVEFLAHLGPEKTLVTATHDLFLVPEIAARCLVLKDGILLADGPTEAILDDLELLERANLIWSHAHHHGKNAHRHAHFLGHRHT